MTLRTLRLDDEGRLADTALLETPGLRQLLSVLDCDGEQARVVGGAVRNALIGRPVADLDIATTAEPTLTMKRVQAAGLRAIPTGLAHGTITVLATGGSFEVTTLRRDVETDGRHAVVQFSRDFGEDAERRDFTINAMFLGADSRVHDTVGGLADLAAGRVRFVGDADRRVREDYLRILRFFRFHAAYGLGPLDAEGLAAAIRHRDAIPRLSRERLRTEMLKLLAADGAGAVIEAMDEAGIAAVVLGGPVQPARLARLAAVEAALGRPADPLLRLMALAGEGERAALRLRDALRLSNEETRRLVGGFEARGRLDPVRPPDRDGCLALLYACGPRGARDGVSLAAADAPPGVQDRWSVALASVQEEVPPVLPIGGAEIMARGISGGRRVGAVLKRFQADWIRAGFPREPARLAALLDAAIEDDRRAP